MVQLDHVIIPLKNPQNNYPTFAMMIPTQLFKLIGKILSFILVCKKEKEKLKLYLLLSMLALETIKDSNMVPEGLEPRKSNEGCFSFVAFDVNIILPISFSHHHWHY